MNIINKYVNQVLVFALAIAIMGSGLMMTGDTKVVEAETLAQVFLTNKGTGKTTEASPPAARSFPSSRTNASTVYATMTDVNTANAVQNSHVIDANKVVITVSEPDHNSMVAIVSGKNDHTAAAVGLSSTIVVTGLSNNPVIDSDSDGDLTDEIYYKDYADGPTGCSFNGSAVTCTGTARATVYQTVSVANGAAATSAVAPMITAIVTTADNNSANDDDIITGYYSSAVNTFQVKAWSTVQLEANASWISVVETGRNTGVFEAEFLLSDTEGVNDNTASTLSQSNTATTSTACATSGSAAVVGGGTPADGRWDRSGGVNADCELVFLADTDITAADVAQGNSGDLTHSNLKVPAGHVIFDSDHDGSIFDEFYIGDDGGGNDFADANAGWTSATTLNVTAVTCATVADCTVAHTADRVLTLTATAVGAAWTNADGTADILFPVMDNVVNQPKVDGIASGVIDDDVTSTDLLSNRVGSDTISTGPATSGLTGLTGTKTGVFINGVSRTPIVEVQANSTVTVQYQDLTDSSTSTTATTGTKQKATVTIDAAAPSPVVSSPTSGTSFKDRQPTFSGSVSDIGSGLDVSTITLIIDMLNDTDATGLTSVIATNNLAGSWLGGAGTILLQDRYDQITATLDNTTTMVDGVTSATWTHATSANIPCSTGSTDGTTNANKVDTGAGSQQGVASTAEHTNIAGAISCNAALATPDVVVDYVLMATDIAGNRGFSDAKATDTDATAIGDPYTLNIDELKPSLVDADTQTATYYNAGTYAEKTDDSTKIRVAFNDEIGTASASSFEVTTDSGSVLTPTSAEIGPKGTDANGASFDFRKNVYLTLPSALAANETPKVKLVGDVADLAGNTTKSGNVAGAIDKIKPTLTLALSGGSGTGAAGTANDSDSLTKSAMTFTITTDEVLSTPPTVSVFDESYGTIGAGGYADLGDEELDQGNTTVMAAGDSLTVVVSAQTIIDIDKDGSLLDEVDLLGSDAGTSVTAAELVGLSVTAVENSSEDVNITIKNNGSASIAANTSVRIDGNSDAAITAASTRVSAEGTVTAVAQDSKTYTASFSGSSFSDLAANDTKAIVVSATDASTSPNTGTVGTRDQGSSSVYKFRLDKTAPVLKNDPDGDSTVGSTTTLPRPYVIFEFTDSSDVTVVSASFGGDDVLAKLATTNNKKYFMVPEADLTAKTYVVKAKGTDLAGNKGAEGSYNLKVTTRKDYKATVLAGWNLLSFPSDPIDNSIGSVFSNAGIDQVVGYDAMSKGSPWQVATKDAASGAFSGSLDTISSGNGYWVHSDEFSSQSVSLAGPEGPSASAPPSIPSIELASGWNLVGVVDATKAKTQANEGDILKSIDDYLGADGGSSSTKAYEYNTSDLAWVELDLTADAGNTDATSVNIGEAYWVFATPAASGLLTPIVP